MIILILNFEKLFVMTRTVFLIINQTKIENIKDKDNSRGRYDRNDNSRIY